LSNEKKWTMEPTITSEGKFLCEDDNSTFNTREEYEKHCAEAHMRSSSRAY
jgi:hypothetical protein